MTLADRLRDVEPSERIVVIPALSPTQLKQLYQLLIVVWDGNLLSKQARGDLVDMGLACRWNGFQIATRDGLAVLDTLRLLKEQAKPTDIARGIFND